MATDSTELTFVRCRSCGALVPATASSCRICNSTLDGTAPDDRGAGSRIRQRTMSQTPEQVKESIAAFSGGSAKAASEEVAPLVETESKVSEEADPLEAFLEEVEESPAQLESSATNGATNGAGTHEEETSEAEVKAASEEFEAAPPKAAQPTAKPVETAPPTVAKETASPPVDEPLRRYIPPAVENSPKHQEQRQARNDRPNFDRDRQQNRQQQPQRENKFEPNRGGQRRAEQGRHEQHERHEKHEKQERQNNRPDAFKARSDEGKQLNGSSNAKQSASRVEKTKPGKLCAWLISYNDPDGVATEIRSGKFFVSSAPLKSNDLIIDEPSVSMPHALVAAGDKGVMIQDLMSDNGVFVRSFRGGEYERQEAAIRLEHGDWIKFGDVEYQVAIVPGR